MQILTLVIFSFIIESKDLSSHIKLMIGYSGIILASMTLPHYWIKSDLNDGYLETLLSITSSFQIIMVKNLCLDICLIASAIMPIFFMMIIFDLSVYECIYLLIAMILTIEHIASLLVLTNILHAYFKRNTNLIISVIMPLIIPHIIISFMGLEFLKIDFLLMLFGMNMILVTITFLLSNYLLKHLYNF
jgi:ABC-type transport system involved in cytochrome c biogenesis permease component